MFHLGRGHMSCLSYRTKKVRPTHLAVTSMGSQGRWATGMVVQSE
jgi:hypothetical protein